MRSSVLALCTVLMLGSASALFADDLSVKLQRRGVRRDALNAMTYKPFDTALLGKLADYKGGSAIDESAIKGKPVLLVVWSSWFKSSHVGLNEAQKLITGNPDLVVLGVHHQRGYDKVQEALAATKITFPVAHDASGDVLKALRVEGGGPTLYVVDRAGNMRFADVERGSLAAAVKIVVEEKPEDAAKAEQRVQESIRSKSDAPLAGPSVKTKPADEAYKGASWPKPNRSVQYAKNVQGKPLPVAFGKETWITPKPDLTGKVIVLDFWATWCGPCIAASPMLDELQGKFNDDLVIVGVSGQARPGRPEDVGAIKDFLKKKKSDYSHANDLDQGVYKSLGIQGIPHVVVLSTDGVVRWQGNPHEETFTKAVEGVIENDPWVKARKARK